MSPSDMFRLMRPRQWAKNLAVFAAIIFSGHLFIRAEMLHVCVAFVVLSLVSSGLYALNDALDAERDRQHPIKCDRPVASGRISVFAAIGIGAVLSVVGLAIAWLLGVQFFATVMAFFALHILYSAWFKTIAIVDMLVIAVGFVLRAVAGAVLI
ncbi:MAG: UbiA family prenyltransferase [Coriobacteriia bacterium]